MPAARLGFKGKIYRNTASFGSPTWDEVTPVGDVTVTLTMDEAEATTREGAGVKQFEPTLDMREVSFKLREDETVTDYTALETAYFARSLVDVMVLTGPSDENGVRGIRGEMKVFDWTLEQGLGDVQMRSVKLKPCVGNLQQKVTVTSGAPVFS